MKTRLIAPATLSMLLMAMSAMAQDGPASEEGKFMPADMEDKTKGSAEEVPVGWDYLLKGAANFAVNNNDGVVGSPDGTNLNFGFMLNGKADHLSDNRKHEWLNSLNWQLGFSKTPVVDDVYKNIDGLDFETIYLFHLPPAPWFGPFAAFQLKTVMFPSYAVYGEDKVITYSDGPDGDGDGVPDPVTIDANTRIELTDAFAPTSLRETLGVFAIPIDKPEFKFDARAGWGFWETFVRDGYSIKDASAAVLEINPMTDAVEIGPELRLGAGGLINEMVSYSAKALFMYPAYASEEIVGLEGMDKLNMEFEFLLGVKLWEWASIDYIFKAYKLPVIYNDWQVQNSLLLSITFSVVSDQPAPEELAPETPAVNCPVDCPVADAPTEATPTEATPTEATPTEVTPTEATPTEATPTENTPVTE